MQLCKHHPAIAYEGDICPLCFDLDLKNDEICKLNSDLSEALCDVDHYKERLKIMEEAYRKLEADFIRKGL